MTIIRTKFHSAARDSVPHPVFRVVGGFIAALGNVWSDSEDRSIPHSPHLRRDAGYDDAVARETQAQRVFATSLLRLP